MALAACRLSLYPAPGAPGTVAPGTGAARVLPGRQPVAGDQRGGIAALWDVSAASPVSHIQVPGVTTLTGAFESDGQRT